MSNYLFNSVAASRVSPLVRQPATKPRRCLDCGNFFPSTGPGNRVCPVCSGSMPRAVRDNGGKTEYFAAAGGD